MKDKTREQLVNELTELRQTVAALRAREVEGETARGQRLLLALSQAAQAVQQARTPKEVYQTLADEIVKLGYHATIFTLNDDRTHLTVAYLSFEPDILQRAEKLTGLSAGNYSFPLKPGGFYRRIMAEGNVILSDPGDRAIREALPVLVRPLAGRLANVLGLGQAIYAPLKVGGDAYSLLTVMGRDLTEADVPAVSAFVSQAAIAVKNARLYQGARQEIAERKQAEEGQRQALAEAVQATQALRESEKRYRELVEGSLQGIVVRQGNSYILVNQSFADMVGYSIGELLEFTLDQIYALVHPDDREMISQRYRDRQAGKVAPDSYEHRFIRKDGGIRWSQAIVTEIEIQGDQAFKGVYLDVTERKRVETEREQLWARVREQARQMQQIIATVPEGVLLLDAGGRVILANPVAEQALSLLADVQVGDTLTRLSDRPLAELLNSPPTKGLWHDVQIDEQTFEVIARPIENTPDPEDWVMVINDVTREREVQQRIQQQERLASVGQLAAGIAHDFNNIMATIVLYAQMSARTESLPDRVRERMMTINRQAQHATRLIQQILDFGRRAVLKRRPLDLLPVMKEQVTLLKRTLPESIRIDLVYIRDEYATLFLVNADPTRMQQMVTNLAVNARDAMPEGGSLYVGLERIQVETRETAPLPEMEAGEWVQIMVADTGTGIPPDVLPHIYEPFFTTRAPLCSGLGLAQAHGIVAQHEGHIDVETQVGQGTTFIIYLPALTDEQSEHLPQRAAHLTQGKGQTILVVEDNATAREALVQSLTLLGYRVLEARDGQQAIEIFEQQDAKPDHDTDRIVLVLSDVVMPGIGGILLFYTLRDQYPDVRVVLLTGHSMGDELESLRAQGLSGWLLKPPDLDQLAEVMAQALGEE